MAPKEIEDITGVDVILGNIDKANVVDLIYKKVKENEVVGSVEIVIDGIVVDKINILSCCTFSEPSIWENFKEIINT